ncbi:hypothetical protein KY358_01090 [Candidatus Woesearchaeota archaeon]|nr:hypothetical protein [Candidatus Woesearchaeota archaeon]
MLNRKGQISIFIIIGMVILLGVISYFYLSRLKAEEIEVPTERLTETPGWAEPVNKFVEECIRTISIRGFEEMGYHGGYIDPDDGWLSGKQISISQKPTESDAVLLSGQNIPIAYWWYLKSPNDCVDCEASSLMPSFPEIEGQMDRYIERELEKCLDDFNILKKQGLSIETGSIKAHTTIQENDIGILVDYPIDIAQGDRKTTIPSFYFKLDLKLREIMELAFLTTIDQINMQTQEDILMHMISIYSNADSPDNMAPIGWVDHKNSIVTWNVDTIENNLKNYLLGSHIPMVQVNKTREAKHITSEDPLEQGLYDHMFLRFLDDSYKDLALSFHYDPSWEIYFDITPKKGNIIMPTTHTQEFLMNIVPSKKTNLYHFFYDIGYPVIVTIRDNSSLKSQGKKGYSFMFALECNVRDNKDLLSWNQGLGTLGEISYENIIASVNIEQTVTGECKEVQNNEPRWKCSVDGQLYSKQMDCEKLCKEKVSVVTPNAKESIVKSLACSPLHRISKPVSITILDEQDNPLEGVAISFRCGNHKVCPMEETGGDGKYISRFPICDGDGFLTFEKDSYLTKVEPHISISQDNPQSYTFRMESLRKMEIEIAYINVTNMFRIKKELNSKKTMNILNKTDYKVINYDSDGNKITTHYGILEDIYSETSEDEDDNHAMAQLKSQVRTKLKSHRNMIEYVRNRIQDVNHHYEINRADVSIAAKKALEAIEYSRKVTNGTLASFDVSISTENRIEEIREFLRKELKNIQFLGDYELIDKKVVQRYKDEADGLKIDDQVIVSVEKVKETEYEQNIPLPVDVVEYGKKGYVNLIPGKYNVIATSIDKIGYSIPKEDFMPDLPAGTPSFSGADEDQSYSMIGQSRLDNVSGQWIISEDQIKDATKVRFYVFRTDKVENMEDMGEGNNIEGYSKRYRAYIEPEFLP